MASASSAAGLLPRSEHLPPGGACGAAYLSPLVGFLARVPGLAVDDRFEHSFGRTAEDDGRCRVLHRMVGATCERHDRQVGALAGRQRTHLCVHSQCPGRIEGGEREGLPRKQGVGAPLAAAGRVDGGAHLLEDIEGRRRGGRVGSEADDDSGGAQIRERGDAAAEQRIRARAVSDRHSPFREQGDLLGVRLRRSARRASPGRAPARASRRRASRSAARGSARSRSSGPVPCSSQSFSFALSARCVPTGMPSDRHHA